MQELQINFNFKARYYKLGPIDSNTKQVWFVLHGYGQLAKFFIDKFQALPNHNICVIAPEGLSRFYTEDIPKRIQTGNNRVGATWMTRENRLMDIDNYINYLDTIFKSEIGDLPVPITMLGFSQGAATVTRWVLNKSVNFSKLILWAGIFPEDMDFEKSKEVLADKQVQFVYGTKDPFLTERRLTEMEDLAQKAGVRATPIAFDGAHEMHEPTLLSLLSN
jgi:predicted esterase